MLPAIAEHCLNTKTCEKGIKKTTTKNKKKIVHLISSSRVPTVK